MTNKEAVEVKKVFYICDKKACNTCHKECKYTSEITHAVNFGIGGHGDFFEAKRETFATNKEVIEMLKNAPVMGVDRRYCKLPPAEAIEVAIAALEKQIPEKPTYAGANQNYSPFDGSPEHIYKCLCGKEIYEHAKYCSACGQALDWRN